jgi:integrase
MPKRVSPLNAKQLEKWKPDPVRTLEKADGAVPGLWVRLTPAGVLSWSLNVRVQGTRRRLALGAGLRLAEARRKAEEARAVVGRGEDPSEARRASRARRTAAALGAGTLGAVVTAYFENGPGAGLRSGAAQRALIERVLTDHLSRPALDVRPAELQLEIDGWRSRSSARHCVAYMRPVAAYAAKRGLMTKGDALEAPAADGRPDQHVLTREEVGQFLRSLTNDPHDAAARFMLLTGARRDEVCGATWGEIELSDTNGGARWTIPAARRKDTRGPKARERTEDHIIPLSRQALALLNEIARRQGCGDVGALVFQGVRGARLTNWPRWSARKETGKGRRRKGASDGCEPRLGVSADEARAMAKRKKRGLGFALTPHALRRTTATLAGDLGQPPHVVSALLGHRSIGGALHAGYNQSRYRREVADALQMVADLLDALERGEDNIVTLRRA